MTWQLPKLPLPAALKDAQALAVALYQLASDVYEFMRLQPTVEFKTFTTVGDFPIYVQTQTPRARSVKRVQTYLTDDPASEAAYLADSALSWRLSDDPDQPGIIVTGVGGVVGPDELTITLEILGDRESAPEQGGA